MTTETTPLEQFKDALGAVAALGETTTHQEAAVLDQEGDLLTQILTSIKPIMRYIDYPIRASGSHPGGQFAHWEYIDMPEHGIYLAGGEWERYRNGDQNRGEYRGSDLVLTRSGKLLYRTVAGSWSHWQGESEYWTTSLVGGEDQYDSEYDLPGAGPAPSTSEVAPSEALKHFDLEEILKGITRAVQEAISKAESKQHTLGGRLARLDAVRAALAG